MSEAITQLTKELMETKATISALTKEAKDLGPLKIDLELRLKAAMETLDLDQVRNDFATVSLSTSIVPSEIDWSVFHAWIVENDMLHLLQRRVSGTEYQTLIEMEGPEFVKGITPYEKVTVKTLKRK